MDKNKSYTIDFVPFDAQREIGRHPARFRVLDCGRRWGKSTFGIVELLNMLNKRRKQTGRKVRGWVVAPTYKLVRECWDISLDILRNVITRRHETDLKFFVTPQIKIEFRSADNKDEGLRGAGLDACLIDEAARVSKEAWEYGIRPALADKQGRAIFISTPKGRNWFYNLYLQGKNGDSDWKSWHYPTNTRPSFPEEEWQTILKTTPENILKQEYLAEFIEDEASVFHNLSSCYRGVLEEPIEGEEYVFGVDLAKTYDWTVIAGIRKSTRGVVYFSRHRETDWSLQKELIKSASLKYNRAKVLLDSTGVGDPIEEDLRKAGCRIEGFKFNNTTKQELVEQLIVAIEQGLVGIPNETKTAVLIDELKAFGYELLPSGRIRYSAPEGLHDDAVIAFGLAVWAIRHILYSKPKIIKPQEKEGTWKFHYNRVKKWNRLRRLPGNEMFTPTQLWEYINA